MVLRALHLCSGYGGFELALGRHARTVAHVERDAYAAATLVARMAEARLDQAPIWSDLTTFDGRPWRGRVDLVTAGFPCQPFSAAGKRLGTDDDRWLWPDIARIIRDVEPEYVFLENVPGVIRAGLAHVLGDLADLGFHAEWGLLAASAVGAPHRRERFWLVAHAGREPARVEPELKVDRRPNDPEQTRVGRGGEDVAEPVGARLPRDGGRLEHPAGGRRPAGHGEDVAEPGSGRGQASSNGGRAEVGAGLRPVFGGFCAAVADPPGVDEREPHHEGRAITRGDARPDIGGHRFPPRPDDLDGWAEWDGAQPAIRRGADGSTEWLADALHLGGNGLVPQCAAEAWRQLTERGGWRV